MGDDFFIGMLPFVDLDSGGDVDGYIKNAGEVIAKVPADSQDHSGSWTDRNSQQFKGYHCSGSAFR